MQRKVFRSGNNLVVSFPKDMLELLSLAEGADVSVELDWKNHQILIRPTEMPFTAGLREDFTHPVSEFIEQYRPVLEALAHK